MSYWDDQKFSAPVYDPSSPFLGRAIAPGESMILTFVEVVDKIRPEDTKVGKAGDNYYEVYFLDSEGKEKSISQNTGRGAMIKALREADVQPNDKINIAREGSGIDTVWFISKVQDDGTPKEKAEAPF